MSRCSFCVFLILLLLYLCTSFVRILEYKVPFCSLFLHTKYDLERPPWKACKSISISAFHRSVINQITDVAFQPAHLAQVNFNRKKCAPKLIVNENKLRNMQMVFDVEHWLWKSKFHDFWNHYCYCAMSTWTISKNYFAKFNFLETINLMLNVQTETPQQ